MYERIYIVKHNDSITVYYNKKMCFATDAKEWDLSADEASKNISANSYQDFEVTENLWATSVAFSMVNGSKRFITLGCALNEDDRTMTVETLMI